MASTSQQTEQRMETIFPPFLEETELSKWLLQPEKEQQGQAVLKFQIFIPDDDPEIWLADNTGSYIDSQLPILPSYGSTPAQVSTVNLGSLLKTMDMISHSPNDQWLMCVRFDYFQQMSEQDDSEWLLSPSQQLMRSQEQEEEMEEGETISRLQEANHYTDPLVSQEVIKGHQSIQAGLKQAPRGKRGRGEPASQTSSQNTTSGKRTRKK
ncbi:hypothetical protein HOLleu_38068 [Holothuria leucospilota]|uniref:Uncharacterized protein n=1 Tax=Holothuria leucospilota TaxID=206669 RepID=A0A9Q0YPT8_HOLLE|nr:hypothetical protein HOLleu_38068 [Holothuria leucospilota]